MIDLDPVDIPNVKDVVYELLKDKILNQDLAPGQQLDLPFLEEQLHISRTPLKDALTKLESEGLIEIRPRRGTFVTDLTAETLSESFDVRDLLEAYAAELALQRASQSDLEELRDLVQRMTELTQVEDWHEVSRAYVELDQAFHSKIAHMCGNKCLADLYNRVNLHVQIARIRDRHRKKDQLVAQSEHEAILAAFEAGDAVALRNAIDEHVRRAKDRAIASFSRPPV